MTLRADRPNLVTDIEADIQAENCSANLPAQPLLDLIGDTNPEHIMLLLDRDQPTPLSFQHVLNWRSKGRCSPLMADAVCEALNTHPFALWGNLWGEVGDIQMTIFDVPYMEDEQKEAA